ncbi:MAG: signal peptidase I [Bacteroidota bacterium]
MTKNNDWYRLPAWSKKDQELFENKLNTTRSRLQKAHSLRIKALVLLDSNDPTSHDAGRVLLKRIISDYPDQKGEVVYAYEGIGVSLQKDGNYKEAEEFYRKCISFYKEKLGNTGWTINSHLYLAEVIVQTEQKDNYTEAEHLLDEWKKRHQSMFNSEIYRYCVLRARLATKLNKKTDAITYARNALSAAEAGKHPQFSRHPTEGVVREDSKTLDEMRQIADEHSKILEVYSITQLQEEDKTYFLRFNKWLWTIAPHPKLTFQVGIVTPLKTDNNGMPTGEENAQLLKMEELIRLELEKSDETLYVGTITGGGMKEFVFYTSNPKAVEGIFQKLKNKIKHHELQLMIQEDKDWRVFKTYCPKIINKTRPSIKNLLSIIFLILFPLLGILFMWFFANWSKKRKILLTIILLMPLIAAATIYPFIVQPYQVNGQSMAPTLEDGQYLLANKFVYNNSTPQRGDIVVFKNPTKPDTENIKRIVGLPGEKIKIEDRYIYIYNIRLQESYLASDVTTDGGTFLKNGQSVDIPKDYYAVLGDNRSSGSDSRAFGFVPRSYIVGKYWFSYFPIRQTIHIRSNVPMTPTPYPVASVSGQIIESQKKLADLYLSLDLKSDRKEAVFFDLMAPLGVLDPIASATAELPVKDISNFLFGYYAKKFGYTQNEAIDLAALPITYGTQKFDPMDYFSKNKNKLETLSNLAQKDTKLTIISLWSTNIIRINNYFMDTNSKHVWELKTGKEKFYDYKNMDIYDTYGPRSMETLFRKYDSAFKMLADAEVQTIYFCDGKVIIFMGGTANNAFGYIRNAVSADEVNCGLLNNRFRIAKDISIAEGWRYWVGK